MTESSQVVSQDARMAPGDIAGRHPRLTNISMRSGAADAFHLPGQQHDEGGENQHRPEHHKRIAEAHYQA